MLYFDIKRPFSEAKNVVAFLEGNNLNKGIVASVDGPIPAISCYLQKRTYSLSSGALVSFYRWNDANTEGKLDSATLLSARTLAQQADSSLTLVTYDSISKEMPGVVFLKGFTHGMIKVENYYIYEISASGND